MPNLAPLSLLSVAAVGLPAQTTHLVGPGGLPQIRDALAIAAPGDVIHVQAGTYAHFTADKGVTIRALVPGTVTVAFDPTFESPACLADPICAGSLGTTRFAPPTGQAVHVTGMRFAPTIPTFGMFARHRVTVASGVVTFDGCTLQIADAAALAVGSALVHLQGCSLGTTGSITAQALFANGGQVTAVDTVFTGGSTLATPPGDGVQLVNASLAASGCVFAGGSMTFGGSGGSGLRVDNTSRAWVSDSTLTGGTGGCAYLGLPGSSQFARCTLNSSGVGCSAATTASLIGVERPTVLQNGALFTIHVHTEPSVPVAIHASPRLGFAEAPGVLSQPVWLDLSAFFLAGVFGSDPNGDVTATWAMPAGVFVDETLWFQTIALPATGPILVGPVVGGVIR